MTKFKKRGKIGIGKEDAVGEKAKTPGGSSI